MAGRRKKWKVANMNFNIAGKIKTYSPVRKISFHFNGYFFRSFECDSNHTDGNVFIKVPPVQVLGHNDHHPRLFPKGIKSVFLNHLIFALLFDWLNCLTVLIKFFFGNIGYLSMEPINIFFRNPV